MRKPAARYTIPALATLAVIAAGPVAAQAAASPVVEKAGVTAACTGTKGVTVVVDFTKLGGKIKTACDPTDPKTGLAALTGAGTYNPKPGSVEGWAFGAGKPPGISPP